MMSAQAKHLIEARVNGGRNYNGPKVAEIPCQLNTDLHEWRNEMGAVSKGSSEIVVEVKIPPTRGKTERPRAPLLQLDTVAWIFMCRIGGRL